MDDLLALETSSEEEACWLAAAELDHELAVGWLRQAESVAAGYARAAGAGRAEFAVLEVSCALRIDQLSADRVLTEARQLTGLPRVAEAVETGVLRLPHARALLSQLLGVDPAVAWSVAEEVVAKAEGRTPEQLRGVARRAVLKADPTSAERRRRQAVAQRRMFLRPLDDAMMSLEMHLRAETALRVFGQVEEATRAEDGSGRSADQRRVDWVVEQILRENLPEPTEPYEPTEPCARGGGPGGQPETPPPDRRRRRPVQVQVIVPVAVGLGLSEEPCELVGYGPISAEHGRELLTEAELRKVCVDSRTGQVLAAEQQLHRPVAEDAEVHSAIDGLARREQALAEAIRAVLVNMVLSPSFEPPGPEPGYRPSAHLERTVQLRDVTCDFPFASTPAWRCDTDHTRPYHLGGLTELSGLGSRSRRVHRGKQAGWTPRPDADGGLLWQSPSGATYRRPPPREKPPEIPPDAVLPPARPPARDTDPPPQWYQRPPSKDDDASPSAEPPPPRAVQRTDDPPPF